MNESPPLPTTDDLTKLRQLYDALRWGVWQPGISGRSGIVSFDQDDVVFVAKAANAQIEALIIAMHEALPGLLRASQERSEMLEFIEEMDKYGEIGSGTEMAKSLDRWRKP